MQFVMIFSLVIAVISVMFAMQNTAPVTLQFFIWTFESPLALLIIIALTVGAIITSILTLPGWFKSRKARSNHRKELGGLEESLAKYRTDLIDSQNKNKDLRQKILEVEEAKENLERAHHKTEEEISDMKEALANANLTAEAAEIARKEALDARAQIDAALKDMEVKMAAAAAEQHGIEPITPHSDILSTDDGGDAALGYAFPDQDEKTDSENHDNSDEEYHG